MRLGVGSDHAGFQLKKVILELLKELSHEAVDLGTFSSEPVDYPDYAEKVGVAVRDGTVQRGILICGSGVGASVAANKIPGVRAALCHDTYSAHQGVEHDDMNVLVMGERVIGVELAKELVRAFVSAAFSAAERHVRRLNKVKELERRYLTEGSKEAKDNNL